MSYRIIFFLLPFVTFTINSFGEEPPGLSPEEQLKKEVEKITPEVEKFVSKIKKKAETDQNNVESFVDSVNITNEGQNSGEVFSKEGTFNVGALMRKYQAPAKQPEGIGETHIPFAVFVSLSMPSKMLENYLEQTLDAKGVVILQGFVNGSMKDTATLIQKFVKKEDQGKGLMLNPNLFKAFDVKTVPTFVVMNGKIKPCAGSFCVPEAPPHDKISGAVSVQYALEAIRDRGDNSRDIAKLHLEYLGDGK